MSKSLANLQAGSWARSQLVRAHPKLSTTRLCFSHILDCASEFLLLHLVTSADAEPAAASTICERCQYATIDQQRLSFSLSDQFVVLHS